MMEEIWHERYYAISKDEKAIVWLEYSRATNMLTTQVEKYRQESKILKHRSIAID